MKLNTKINIFFICIILSTFPLACSRKVSWTSEDKASAIHYYNSQDANRASIKILQRGTPYAQMSKEQLSRLLMHMKAALSEAKMVTDDFLDKVHPDFRKYYRYEYQKSLELRIKILEEPNSTEGREAHLMYNAWVDWVENHRTEFQFPPP